MPATTFIVIAVFTVTELLQAAAVGLLLRRLTRRMAVLSASIGVDHLTGLPGRGGLHDAYRALAAAGTPPVVLLLDLNGFKKINDRHGHDAGDDVLRAVAGRLAAVAVDNSAFAGRLGGDEFVVLLPGDDAPADLAGVISAVRAAVGAPIVLGEDGEQVTVSCVVGAARSGPGADRVRPFRTADIALYHARHHSVPWALYHPGMTHPAAAERHGARLRDRRPAPPVVLVDPSRYTQPAVGDVSDDVAHLDDIAEFQELLEVLDPRSRDFGTDVADLIARSITHEAIQLRYPVTGLSIQPTTRDAARDGGFLVLVEIDRTITLASPHFLPRAFDGAGTSVAEQVMAAVAETADRLYTGFRTVHMGGPARR